MAPKSQERFEAELDYIYSVYGQYAQAHSAAEAHVAMYEYLLQQRGHEAVAGLLATALDRMHRNSFTTFTGDS